MPSPDRAPGELRFDPLTREWVNIVAHRQHRPNLPDDGCPFCPGGLEAPERYDVRCFPNRWPAFAPGAPIDLAAAEPPGGDSGDSGDSGTVGAVGACEIVLFSPEHDQSLGTLAVEQVRKVIDLWADRTEALYARPEIAYVLVFENRGREVGATIDHPHGQIYAYPAVPPAPAREAANARAHGCAVCADAAREAADGTRVVTTAGDWVAWVPYAARYAYGMTLAPRTHTASFPALDDTRRDDLARVLTDALGRYDRLWPGAGPAPYMCWFHQAPAPGADPDADAWHIHAHVAPPWRAAGVARYVAAGELGSGTFSNPVRPEDAAAALRNA